MFQAGTGFTGFRLVKGTRCLKHQSGCLKILRDVCLWESIEGHNLLFPKFLNEHSHRSGLSPYFLNEGIVVLPFWIQADLVNKTMNITEAAWTWNAFIHYGKNNYKSFLSKEVWRKKNKNGMPICNILTFKPDARFCPTWHLSPKKYCLPANTM